MISLDLGILSHNNANAVLPSLSWSQRLQLYTALGEAGTDAQSNYDYGAATRVALVLAHR